MNTSQPNILKKYLLLCGFFYGTRALIIRPYGSSQITSRCSPEICLHPYLTSHAHQTKNKPYFHSRKKWNGRSSTTQLYFFDKLFRNNDDDDEIKSKNEGKNDETVNKSNDNDDENVTSDQEKIVENGLLTDEKSSTFTSRIPFFSSRRKTNEKNIRGEEEENRVKEEKKEMDSISYAKELKRQATKARLEAEKMDAQLTLQKITTLEKKLIQPTDAKDESVKKKDELEDIQNQILLLKRKLEGDTNGSSSRTTSNETSTSTNVSDNSIDKSQNIASPSVVVTTTTEMEKIDTTQTIESNKILQIEAMSEKELEERTQAFLRLPKFIRNLTARTAGFDSYDENSNVTAIVEKMYLDEKKYLLSTSLSQSDISSDEFGQNVNLSKEQLKEMVDAFERLPRFVQEFTAKTAGVYEDGKELNATKVILAMEVMAENDDAFNNFNNINGDNPKNDDDWDNKDIDSPSRLFGTSMDETTKDDETRMIESLFPKSTRKEGETPTSAQIDVFYSQILDKNIFAPSGKPEEISGGYIIRGTSLKENGDDLIRALDEKLDQSMLSGKVSFFYLNDPTPVTPEQMEFGQRPPVIFVTGSNIVKDGNPITTTLLTWLGLTGISFLSIYPFVLNDDVSARVDEQMTLATTSVGGTVNLDFLQELTAPIFFTYIALQIAHEAAHFIVSKVNDFKIPLFPGWVPSPLLGLTSSITALRSSPKNKTALFDFALAGPLTGMICSILAIFFGLQITIGLDSAGYNALPVLPISFLTQSALGGGIIEAFLGENTLTNVVDPSATIHVHPFVIAGYTALFTNALNLTPFGRTDGGRISLALFGRSGAQVVGLITLTSLFLVGIIASDAILLYFAFILFFQSELEIPMRNEVDEVDFGRILLVTLSGVLVLLTILPM